MRDRRTVRVWWCLLPAFTLAIVLGLALSGGSVFANIPSDAPTTGKVGQAPQPVPPLDDAFMELTPESGGPPNGGTVSVGARWVFDLMLNAASHPDATAQQSYFTFTYNLIKNAVVANIPTTCNLTETVTVDISTFETALQNEVCNGPGACIFRGSSVDPGSFAFASGALTHCASGCGGTFRVAQIGMCAVAPGQALIHWQFAPPAPITRDTEIVDINGNTISNPALFTDYVINITGGTTSTPTRTPTGPPQFTPTRTNTPTVPANTPTRTPTPTGPPQFTPTRTNTPTTGVNTPTRTPTNPPQFTSTRTPTSPSQLTPTNTSTPGQQCNVCSLSVHHVDVTCNPDGTVHFDALVQNSSNCTISGERWKATLKVSRSNHGHGNFTTVQVMHGEDDFPHGQTEVGADFCYSFSEDTTAIKVVFELQRGGGNGTDAPGKLGQADPPCNLQGTSPSVEPCEHQGRCQGSYTDVTPDYVFYDEIMGLSSMGVISGYEDGTFRPLNAISRAEIVKVVVLGFDVPIANTYQKHFTDVPHTHPFFSYIEAAYAHKLISGYADGTFRPDEVVSRGQYAKIIMLASGYNIGGQDRPSFSDVPAGSTFYAYIETAHAYGVMNGYGDGTFRPGNDASRGEASNVVYDILTTP